MAPSGKESLLHLSVVLPMAGVAGGSTNLPDGRTNYVAVRLDPKLLQIPTNKYTPHDDLNRCDIARNHTNEYT